MTVPDQPKVVTGMVVPACPLPAGAGPMGRVKVKPPTPSM